MFALCWIGNRKLDDDDDESSGSCRSPALS